MVMGSVLLAIGILSNAASIVIVVALPLVLGSAIHLVNKNRIGETPPVSTGGLHTAKVGSLLFIISAAAATILFHQSVIRTDSYFVLIGIAALGVLLQASAAQTNRWVLCAALVQALALAILLRGQALFESPALTISDIDSHKAMILAWQDAGHLMKWHPVTQVWHGYYDWPLMHISVITAMELTGLSFKPALFVAVGVPFAASLLFVYLFAARVLCRSAGVLALIFVGTSAPHVLWGALLIPTTMGVTLFCAIVYTVMFWRDSVTHTLVFLLLALALVLTHTASSVITLGALLSVALISRMTSHRCPVPHQPLAPPVSVFVLAVAILAKWLHAFHAPGLTFFQMVTTGLLYSAMDVAAPTVNIIHSTNQNPLDSLWLGFAALLLVAGALACIHPAVRSLHRIAGLALVAVLCVMVLGFPLFGMRNILPQRWLPFIFVAGAWLAVLGVTSASAVLKPNRSHILQVAGLAVFAGLSLFSTSIHQRTPLSATPNALSWTASEAAAGSTIARWTPEIITVDRYFQGLAAEIPSGQTSWHPLSTTVPPIGLVTLRHVVRDIMHETGIGTWQAGQGGCNRQETLFFASLEHSPYSQVYQSGTISAFLAQAGA